MKDMHVVYIVTALAIGILIFKKVDFNDETTSPIAAAVEKASPDSGEDKVHALLSGQLINSAGSNMKIMKQKYYLFYFSAHWCPPCRAFTPKLVDFYKKNKFPTNFEVIFVSSDKSEAAMYQYMKEMKMPWLTTKYRGKIAGELSKSYASRGIPHLVVTDRTGKVIFKTYSEGSSPTPETVLSQFLPLLPKQNAVSNTLKKARDIVKQSQELTAEADELTKTAAPKPAAVKTAPSKQEAKSSSKYKLSGIMSSGSITIAFIDGKSYKVGKKLPSGAIIKSITAKEVILEEKGELVKLVLPSK